MTGRLRAAIHTRKSSEEGLDQPFNSLDAQREACKAFIASQKSEGWSPVRTAYDDGGWSGGTMERPALKALLADIAAGRIDIVVVYKVDRLSRSLADFARMVDLFDARSVSFVSVTQAFNTTSSMGRLTLNVLLSFAQFEREVTGERIRDKIAASKAKGMWMGGNVPLGYSNGDRMLRINPAEAATVQHIFRRYLELGSVHALRDDLAATGYRTRQVTLSSGATRGGGPFGAGPLHHLLRNRIYLGEIVHRGTSHKGLHDPIIEHALFEAVQQRLASRSTPHTPHRPAAAPLAGILVDALGRPMAATHARGRSGRRYCYYLSSIPPSHPDAPRVLRRVPAPALETIVIGRLRAWSRRPAVTWPELLAFLRRIELHPEALVLTLVPPAHERWTIAAPDRCSTGEDNTLVVTAPLAVHTRGGRTACIAAGPRTRPDRALIAGLRRAHAELRARGIDPAACDPVPGDARAPGDPYLRRLCALAFLAPDIQRAILEGRQPASLRLADLTGSPVPLCWDGQRRRYGFA